MSIRLIKSTDQTGIPECGWCSREIVPLMGEDKYFLSDAPVVNRVFFHKECGEKVLLLERENK
jgi:hypothetical protein